MVTPDGKVGLGHAGIGAQHKDHGMCLGYQIDGQLRLGPHGIQTRRIENHQSLLEQRMGHIDQGMAPHRHFDPAVGIDHGVVGSLVVMPKAPGPGLIDGDLAHLRHLGQRVGYLLRIGDIQRLLHPGVGTHAPLAEALRRLSGIDGQQTQTRRQLRLPAQLRRTHGGAACTGRHQPAAVMGKEDSVDQLGFAARELGHEGNHDLVGAHLLFQSLQALLHRGVQQILGHQPFTQLLQLGGKTPSPCAILTKLLVE